MAVNYYLDKRTDKKGFAPIRVSVSVLGVRFITSAGQKVLPAKWDSVKQQVRKGAANSGNINSYLMKIKEHFAAYESQCMSDSKPSVSEESLRAEYNQHFGKHPDKAKADAPKGFFDIYALFMKERGEQNQWTKATFQKYTTLKNHLQDWKPKATFDSFTEAGLANFVAFLRDKLQMKNSTIGNQVGYLKWFLKWATAKGFNKRTDFDAYSPKLKSALKKVVFLDWEELMKVYNYKIPKNGAEVDLTDASGKQYKKVVYDAAALAKTRDLFCFCCFTSLRYSDVANLKRSNVADGYINITTIKTADTLKIELNKYALSILQKYDGVIFPDGAALPVITNQRMNVYLKELCELCGINQPITQTYYRGQERIEDTRPKFAFVGTHTGRRTFICNALMLGITPQIVMKWTGHSDYKTMKPYIDVTDTAKAKAMELFNNI